MKEAWRKKEMALWFSSQTGGIQEPGHSLAWMWVSIVLRQGGSSKAVSWWQSVELGLGHQEWQIGQCQGQVLQRGVSGDRKTVRVVWGLWSSEEKYLSSTKLWEGREKGKVACQQMLERDLSGSKVPLQPWVYGWPWNDILFYFFEASRPLLLSQKPKSNDYLHLHIHLPICLLSCLLIWK